MRERHAIAGILALGLGIDLLSFIGWSVPRIAPVFAFAVLLIVAALALRDIRWGIAAVLLELLWGSHGYLLRIPAQGLDLSLRVGLTFVVLVASLWHLRVGAVRQQLINTLRTHPARWPALAFLVTLLLGLLLGVFRHPWDRVFFDANAWGFLALAPAFLLANVAGQKRGQTLYATGSDPFSGSPSASPTHFLLLAFLTGALYLILRTYALLFLFTHDLGGFWMPLYQWVRDTRLGEVTIFPGAFPRVFLPSMVLLFPAALLTCRSYLSLRGSASDRSNPSPLTQTHALLVFGGSIAILLLSLSRSYWLASAALTAIGIIWSVAQVLRKGIHSQFRTKLRMVYGRTLALVASIGIAIVLAVAAVRLPYPKPLTTTGVGETLLARLSADAAVSNRWQQLTPLRAVIAQHPILGSGFGATVTYETKDPRTLAAFPGGTYTTTAFEWGYLDDLLERGLIGLLAELWLIGALIWHGIRRGGGTVAFALGLLAIAIVHATSPYLNHPLGIGIMLLVFAMVTPSHPAEERGAAVMGYA